MGWAMEEIELSTHNGTHVDAPWHYHPTMDGGERAITIDEVPLEWCYQAGVKFDFRHLDDGYLVTPDDMQAELDRIGHELQPLDIIVVNTSAGGRYGEDDYLNKGCGFGRESTLWLTDRGVRVVGTDAWTWDAPFPQTLERWLGNERTPRSSGKVTRPGWRRDIARSRRWGISISCRRPGLT